MAKKPLQKNNKKANQKAAKGQVRSTHRPSRAAREKGEAKSGNMAGGRHPVAENAGFKLKPMATDSVFLHGKHPVEAALKNKNRECLRLIASKKGLEQLDQSCLRSDLKFQEITDFDLGQMIMGDSPHQGLLLEVRPLPSPDIHDFTPIEGQKNIILMLDQVTDPHNVGACMRSAAALGARVLITQDRNSPSENGVLAKSAAGGLETLPWLQVPNLVQAIDTLQEFGYWSVGLDGNTDSSIRDVSLGDNILLIMGSEGKGMRPLTRKNCDLIAKIPMTGAVESLNVSNAAAIALYEVFGK